MTNKERAESILVGVRSHNEVCIGICKCSKEIEKALEEAERRGRREILESEEVKDMRTSLHCYNFCVMDTVTQCNCGIKPILDAFDKFKKEKLG